MSEVTLYGPPQSTYVRTARMILEEKGVAYDLDEIEFGSESHKALHPFARVPVFTQSEVQLFETLAIGYYVNATFAGPALAPDNAAARARMLQWISAIVDYVYPVAIVKTVIERVVVPMRGGLSNEATIAAAKPELIQHCAILDRALGEPRYLAGDDCSLADLFLAPIMFYLKNVPDGEEPLEGRANLAAWFGKISAHPSFAATMPPQPQSAAAE